MVKKCYSSNTLLALDVLISNLEDRLKVAHTGACTEEDFKNQELSRMSSKNIDCQQ